MLTLSADFVHLSHNAGIAACGDRLAVLGLRSQTIHLLQVIRNVQLHPLPNPVSPAASLWPTATCHLHSEWECELQASRARAWIAASLAAAALWLPGGRHGEGLCWSRRRQPTCACRPTALNFSTSGALELVLIAARTDVTAAQQVLPDGRFAPLAQLGPHLAPDDELVLARAAADEARWRAAHPKVGLRQLRKSLRVPFAFCANACRRR